MTWEREYKEEPGYATVHLRPVTLTDRDLRDIGALLKGLSDSMDKSPLSALKFEINGTHKSEDPDDLLVAEPPVDSLTMNVTVEVLVHLTRREAAVHHSMVRPDAVECANRIIKVLEPRQIPKTGVRPTVQRFIPGLVVVVALGYFVNQALSEFIKDQVALVAVAILALAPLSIGVGLWSARAAINQMNRHVLLERHKSDQRWHEKNAATIGIALAAAALIAAVVQIIVAV